MMMLAISAFTAVHCVLLATRLPIFESLKKTGALASFALRLSRIGAAFIRRHGEPHRPFLVGMAVAGRVLRIAKVRIALICWEAIARVSA